MIDISSELAMAFEARMVGDLPTAAQGLSLIQRKLGLNQVLGQSEVRNLLSQDKIDATAAADLFTFLASLERRTGTLENSDHLLAEAHSLGQPRYQYYLQSGLNSLVKSERMRAMHFFRLAHQTNKNQIEGLFAEFNTLIASEDIGLPYEAQLEAFAETYAELLNDSRVSTVRSQLLAMKARMYYRNGNFDALARLVDEKDLGDQTTYYLAWVLSLPYVSVEGKAAKVETLTSRISALSSQAFLGEYHLQTLLGLSSELNRSSVVKLSEKIERIYLWTWRWLMKPQSALLRPIIALAFEVLHEPAGILSKDDFLLLRNSLRWLALFGGVDGTILDQISVFTPTLSSQKMPELEFEDLLLNKLFLFRDISENTAEMQIHWQQVMDADGKFSSWLRQILAQENRGEFAQSILEIARSREILVDGVVVDTVSGAMQMYRNGKEVTRLINQPAAMLIQCLTLKESINLDRAVQTAFGYQSFNEDRHGQRLAKTLSKINTTFPGALKCSRRNDMVVLGEKNHPILLRHMSAHVAQAVNLRILRKDYIETHESSSTQTKKSSAAPRYSLDTKLTRGDIEQILGCSKTKAVSEINGLVEKNLLFKKGSGRYIHYIATEKFYEQLN